MENNFERVGSISNAHVGREFGKRLGYSLPKLASHSRLNSLHPSASASKNHTNLTLAASIRRSCLNVSLTPGPVAEIRRARR
jgi:hypothetical protein